mgnify:CR=1 FL=1
MRELSLERRCAEEYRLLGFCVSAHPLELVANLPADLLPAERMRRAVGRRVRMAGWVIAAKVIRCRKSARFMEFLSCEDLTDTFEATLFPDAYHRLAPRVLGPGPYLLEGRVEYDQGAVSLNVETLRVLEIGPGCAAWNAPTPAPPPSPPDERE